MHTLFITGASGFIGTNLLRRLKKDGVKKIHCLTRVATTYLRDSAKSEDINLIEASIFDAAAYYRYLASSDIVIHLAATTGKAKPEEYFRVNEEGTKFIISQCEKAGIKKFIFISTIAVNFKHLSEYHYAQSKKQAEECLKRARLNFVILRPTIVIGPNAPIMKSLSQLARLPFILVFGDGRTKIQPIYIDDLVDCILFLIYDNSFVNEIFDIGGPEVITFQDLLEEIYLNCRGRYARAVHFPLRHMRAVLRFLERPFYSVLPINAGQLSSFDSDGTVTENILLVHHLHQMTTFKKMLRITLRQEQQERTDDRFKRECSMFCRYLIDAHPNEYVLKKYRNGHTANNIEQQSDHRSFDAFLLLIATSNLFFTRLVDSYTRVCFRRSVFRKKLILLLAILETCSPYYSQFDTVDSSSKIGLFAELLMTLLFFPVCVCISVMFFAPFHLAFAGFSRARILLR